MTDRIDPDRRALLAGAGTALAALAGCLSNPWEPGGSADSSSDGSGSTTNDGNETDEPDDDGTADGDDESTSEPETPPDPDVVVDVAKEDFQFTPEQFEITAGSTVKWVWRDGGHNVRPDEIPEGSDWDGTDGGDSTTYPEGHELVSTFETSGEYDYYCAPHRSLGLRGSFTVREE